MDLIRGVKGAEVTEANREENFLQKLIRSSPFGSVPRLTLCEIRSVLSVTSVSVLSVTSVFVTPVFAG